MPDRIDENPIDDGEFTSAEEIGPVVLWPTAAIEGALADRDRLADIIDRVAELLRARLDDVALMEGRFLASDRLGRAVREALEVLAEAEPGDPEGGGGGA